MKYTCEYMPGGMLDLVCGKPTNLLVSYGGGEKIAMCIGHIILDLTAEPDPYYQQQSWEVTHE